MSEIKLINKDSRSLDISIKSGKHELLSNSEAHAWLKEVASGKSLFTSVISLNVSKRLEGEVYSGVTVGTGTMLGISLGLVGAVIPATILNWDLLTVSGVGTASLAFLGTIANRVSSKYYKNFVRIWDELKHVEEQGLRSWLKARYDITLTKESSEALAEFLLRGHATDFVDIKEQPWVVKYSEEDKGWFVEPRKPSTIDEAKTVEKVIVETALPGESGVIFGSIELRLDTLKNYSFAAETSHNLLRIKEDVRQAVVSFRKLEALGEGESGESQLVRVLSALNDELLTVIQQEAEDVRNDLAVQGNYVLSRHLEAGVNSAIRLEGRKAVDDTLDVALSKKD